MKKFENLGFLILLVLWLSGCGGSVTVPIATNSTTGYVEQVKGPLVTRVFSISYADSDNPYTGNQINDAMLLMNSFIVRNSSGLAWVDYDIVERDLPLTAREYASEDYISVNSKLKMQCLGLGEQKVYNLYILPNQPPINSGGYTASSSGVVRAAFLSAVLLEPTKMPIPHEFGHMLGLVHQPSGVMNGEDANLENDYNGFYDNESLKALGWISN